MSLPASHPKVHEHAKGKCPVTSNTNEWRAPQPGDLRSPCPALNTLANHGYIARDGKNLSAIDLIRGLKAGYNLSTPLAAFLTLGGFVLLRKIRNISLADIGRHGKIEHDASLVHEDTPPGQKYAPINIIPGLVDLLSQDAKTGNEEGEGPEAGDRRVLLDAEDVARARVRREKQSKPLDPIHAEIARGEMAILLGMMNVNVKGNQGVPVEWVREWIGHERLPKDWNIDHVQSLRDTKKRSTDIRNAMKRMRKEEAGENAKSGVLSMVSHRLHSISSSTPTTPSKSASFSDEKQDQL